MGYTLLKLNCEYHLCFSYKEDINPCFKSKEAAELTKKLKNLIAVYRENLQHAQKIYKQAHDKGTKYRRYASNKKICFNSKYIKTKSN